MSKVIRCISTNKKIVLDRMDGRKTLSKAKDIFSKISGFKKVGGLVYSSNKEKNVFVFEIIKDTTFKSIFDSLNGGNNDLFLQQDHIMSFAEKYSEWIRTPKHEIFFPFKTKKGCHLAGIYQKSDGLHLKRFDFSDVLLAEYKHRIVLPESHSVLFASLF